MHTIRRRFWCLHYTTYISNPLRLCQCYMYVYVLSLLACKVGGGREREATLTHDDDDKAPFFSKMGKTWKMANIPLYFRQFFLKCAQCDIIDNAIYWCVKSLFSSPYSVAKREITAFHTPQSLTVSPPTITGRMFKCKSWNGALRSYFLVRSYNCQKMCKVFFLPFM